MLPAPHSSFFFLIELQLLYNITEVTGVQYSESHFLKVVLHLQLF